MRISSRFTEYGLTGAFLLISQCVLYFLSYDESSSYSFEQFNAILKTAYEAFPPAFQPALMSLAAALALVSIFFIGLCLDLLGSFHTMWEANQFKKQLEKNETWLRPFVDLNKYYVGNDYNKFESEFGTLLSKEEWKESFKILLFWKKQYRRDYFDYMKKAFNRFRLLSAYNRFHSFLMSYVMVHSGSGNNEFLIDQVHLWRTSRSISTALIIMAFELLYFVKPTDKWLYVTSISYFFMLGISAFITLRSYKRMCGTLLAFVYTIASKEFRD